MEERSTEGHDVVATWSLDLLKAEMRPTVPTIALIALEECPMRHIVMTIVIVVVLAATSLLREMDAFSSMSTAPLRLVVLAAALPPMIAVFAWPPRGVLVTAIVVLLLTLMAVPLSNRWAELGSAVSLLLVADILAVILAVLRTFAIRRAEERAGLTEIRQALAEQYDLAAFAGVVAWSGRRVMGPGTLRLWVLDRQREELRMVRAGDHARINHGPDADTLRMTPDRIRLDTPDPRARAARLTQPMEGVTGWGLGRDAETPLDMRLRRGDAVYVGVGLGGSYAMLRGLFGNRFRGRSEHDETLAVPVQCRGETVGVLAYERRTRPSERFTADDRARLAKVADMCAKKMDRSQPRAPASK